MNRQITYTPSRRPPTDRGRAAGDPVAMTSPRSHLVDPTAQPGQALIGRLPTSRVAVRRQTAAAPLAIMSP
jgi:hypothetical protein